MEMFWPESTIFVGQASEYEMSDNGPNGESTIYTIFLKFLLALLLG